MNEHCPHCKNGGLVAYRFDHIAKRAGLWCGNCKRWLSNA